LNIFLDNIIDSFRSMDYP